MPQTKPLIKNLKGYGAFIKVITEGKRINVAPVKAFLRSTTTVENSIAVGFSVTKKVKKAVTRNRIKRLMRESFRANKSIIIDNFKNNSNLEIIFMYNEEADIAPSTVRFLSINEAVAKICQAIQDKLKQ